MNKKARIANIRLVWCILQDFCGCSLVIIIVITIVGAENHSGLTHNTVKYYRLTWKNSQNEGADKVIL